MMDTVQQKSPSVKYQPKNRLDIIVNLKLKPTVRKTLLAVDSYMNSTTGLCVPRVSKIAKRRGICIRTAQYHLKALEGLGLLKRLPRHGENGRQRSNAFLPCYLDVAQAHPFRGGVSDTGRRQPLHPPSCTPVTKAGEQIEPKPKKDNATPIASDRVTLTDAEWYEAWDLADEFIDGDRENRGLLAHQFSFIAQHHQLPAYQEACDRLRIPWRLET